MAEFRTGREKPSLSQRLMVRLMPALTPLHAWLYRRYAGRFGNKTPAGGPVLLLTTTGRRSGEPRTVPLGCLDDGEVFFVAGSNGGKPQVPGWVYNIRANPRVEVQVGRDRFATKAEILEGTEREEHWKRFTERYPDYGDAQVWAGRTIPLIRLPRKTVTE